MNKFICERCDTEFTSRGSSAKYCNKCRVEVKRINGRNQYYKKIGRLDLIMLITQKPKKMWGKFVWTGSVKFYCPLDNCPFKSGNRPCLFYIERKNGKATCPNAKALNEFNKQNY